MVETRAKGALLTMTTENGRQVQRNNAHRLGNPKRFKSKTIAFHIIFAC
jgi:hypothetical protein